MKKYLKILLGLLMLSIVVQIGLADNISIKWSHFRWYLVASILSSFLFSKFRMTKKLLANFFVMYFVIGTSVACIYKIYKDTQLNGEFLWDELTAAILLTSGFFIVVFSLKRLDINLPKILSAIQFLLLLPYLLNIFYSILEHDCITTNSLIAIYQTNTVEILEFLKTTAPIYAYFLATVVFGLIYCFFYQTIKSIYITSKVSSLKEGALLMVTFLGIAFILNKTFNDTYFNRIIGESENYLKSVQRYNSYRYNSDGKTKYIDASVSDYDDGTHLVVIGESQNKKHMSAYGYIRDTTPWLKSKLTSKNFVFMENGYACNTLTMLALSQALTEKSQYNKKPLERSYSVIDIAKAAGFKTYWISNQAQYGSFNTPITLIANTADEKIWLNSDSSAGNSYDEKILSTLKYIQTNKKKIIFIHLYGNHWEYKYRYPQEEYSKFSNAAYNGKVANLEKLNEYDNSIYYNDHIMKEIFEYAQKKWNISSMVYFSDHGEAVLSNNKHIPSKYEDDMGTVPVYFYFSDSYIQLHQDKINQIKKSKNIKFTNDMMYNAMLNIWGINTPYYDEREDFLSTQYKYKNGDLLILDTVHI